MDGEVMILLFRVLTSGSGISIRKGQCTHDSDAKYHGVLVNCSHGNLTGVPRNLPDRTTTLLLDHNMIHIIPDKVFLKLTELKKLDISNNRPLTFSDKSFWGLSKLEVLKLYYQDSDFKGVGDYPDESLSQMTSLKALFINGLRNDFGPGFAKLRSLRNLSLSSGSCSIGRLKNTTFQNVPFIKTLNISSCSIDDTDLETFSPLLNVEAIDVSNNKNLGFRNLSKALYGLTESPIKVLRMNSLYSEYGSCSEILVEDIEHLQNTNLTHLYVDSNGITRFARGALRKLPRTLEYLSARDNRFAFGRWVWEVTSMPSLKFLDISLLNAWHSPHVPFEGDETLSEIIIIPLPPKLTTIVAEDCFMKGAFIKSRLSKNSLRKVNVKHNLLSAIEGPISGIELLEYIDLSHNILETVDHGVIPVNNSIMYINFAYNYLGKLFEGDINGSILLNFRHAKLVDLSHNMIEALPVNIFQGLRAVEKLHISDNYLEDFEPIIKHLINLTMLNLSNNKLKGLSENFLAELHRLNNTQVKLHGNPLLCSCSDLYFLHFMKTNKYQFPDLRQTRCELPNGSSVYLTNLQDILAKLDAECHSPNKMLINSLVILLCCLFILCIVGFSLAYRHRWKIRYFYHIARRRYWTSTRERLCEQQYRYDVFVSYAETDSNIVIQEMISELEGKASLKMCIHHRDFIPGEVIASNIVNAIDSSKKTLIILSPDFLQSDWCIYEYQIALQTRVTRRQNSLLILLYKHVPVQDLPKDMAALLSTNCYLEYNPDVYGREAFWQNLVEAVKSLQPLE